MNNEDRRRAARERLAAQRQRERNRARQQRRRRAFAVLGVVVLGFGLLVGLRLAGVGGTKSATPSGSLPPGVLAQVTGVPAATLARIGAGTGQNVLVALPGPDLVQGSKPRVVYIGAEYCPFCAAERWAVVAALSRFGTWSGLSATRSAADDAYPNTATFSFHGATFRSDHLTFEGVETSTNQRAGSGYAPLDTPTAEQTQLMRSFDVPPYVPAQSAGAIPFLDLGNRYLISGASFSPELLAERSVSEIAQELTKPDSAVSLAVLGSANRITAAVCRLTHDQPASVCAAAPIPALEAELPRG